MFKNLTLCRIALGADLQVIEQALAREPFAPCGATQLKSSGWVPPRGDDHGALVEAVAGQWIARFVVESKSVPSDALRRKVDELAAGIEVATGRVPGKRERKDLREDALQELLPQAFAKQAAVWVWIDPETGLLAIDTASMARVDEVTSSLTRSLEGAGLRLIQTQSTPQSVMTQWLAGDDVDVMPNAFNLGRATILLAAGEQPARVKFDKHDLRTDEVRQHVVDGKLPTTLALCWQGRISFTLTQHLQVKGIGFDDGIFHGAGDEADRFDTDATICTAELRALLADLMLACGGEQEVKT